MAWGQGVAAGIGTIITLVAASYFIKVRLSAMLMASMPSVLGSAVMCVPVLAWLHWSERHVPALVQALGGAALGAAVFGAVLLMLDREMVRNARRHFLPRTA